MLEEFEEIDELDTTDNLEQQMLAKVILNNEPESNSSQLESAEELADLILTPEQRESRRLAKKPSIQHLKPGVVVKDGVYIPLFGVGDRIVVERYASLVNGCPWLDTLVYSVVSIDDDTGFVRVMEEESRHSGYVSFKDTHTTIKLAPVRGNPFEGKRRGRRSKMMKKIIEAQIQKDEELQREKNNDLFISRQPQNIQPDGGKRRGRPKGSKNRAKSVVAAERKLRRDQKREKRERRKNRI